jgi:hypothetical protein
MKFPRSRLPWFLDVKIEEGFYCTITAIIQILSIPSTQAKEPKLVLYADAASDF